MATSQGLVGRFWGGPVGVVGASWGGPGRSWGGLGNHLASKAEKGQGDHPHRPILGTFWAHFGSLLGGFFNDFLISFSSYLEMPESHKTPIFVVRESLSRHYRTRLWRTGQDRTRQDKTRQDRTGQDRSSGRKRRNPVQGGGVSPTLKGGTASKVPPPQSTRLGRFLES